MANLATQHSATTSLTGPERAAILVMYLEPEVAREVLKHFETDELDAIGRAMARVATVEPQFIETVVAEFIRDLNTASLVPRTGADYVMEVLPTLLPDEKKDEVQRRLRRVVSTTFRDTVQGCASSVLHPVLRDEHPQTQALALLLMGPTTAARVLKEFDETTRDDLTRRMARIDQVPTDLAEELEADILTALEDERTEQWSVRGLEGTAKILGSLGVDDQEEMLDRIAESEPDLSENLRRRLVLFEDLVHLEERSLQHLLRVVERNQLKVALRGADPWLIEHFLTNLSSRAASDLREDLQFGERVPRATVEAARDAIVETALSLREEGAIMLPIGPALDLV